MWDTGRWTPPIRISEAIKDKWWEQVSKKHMGVYRLIALEAIDSLVPAKLPRVCGVDETGTLSIGASRSLMGRLGALVKTNLPEYVGKPHRVPCRRLADRFPPEKLAFSWECSDSPWDRESELHRLYEGEFGELPPMDKMS